MEPLQILKNFEKQVPGFLGAAVGPANGPVAELNPTELFPAASLIKIPILLYLLKQREAGRLELSEFVVLRNKDKVGGSGVLLELHDGTSLTLLDLATLMIVVSDNTATNLLIDHLGLENIQTWIQELDLRQTLLARKLIGTPEASSVNFTAPRDMFNLFKMLVLGKVLSPANTELAIGILTRQQYNEKIPLLLPKEARVAHKTGEISEVRHDCGIVECDGRSIILSLLTKGVTEELKADRILAELSMALFRHYFRAGS